MRPANRNEELRRVYREHVDAVYAFLAYSVGRQVAEDLTATTFERVLRHWNRYDAAKASERTWILSIARNALIDHYRRSAHRDATSLDEHPLIAERLATQADPIADALSADAFTGWLALLGDRDRTVLAMRYGADLSAAEIAEALELTEANVHQIASRAVRRLRALVDPDET
ncbi:MAG: sigma-70 family RNA polymerase sigma factor [Solirubrobacteraceae bacterium]|nr:sigma-70 family RNA polymerase sigma factor [Solirubrobacteraceae bacterium]